MPQLAAPGAAARGLKWLMQDGVCRCRLSTADVSHQDESDVRPPGAIGTPCRTSTHCWRANARQSSAFGLHKDTRFDPWKLAELLQTFKMKGMIPVCVNIMIKIYIYITS